LIFVGDKTQFYPAGMEEQMEAPVTYSVCGRSYNVPVLDTWPYKPITKSFCCGEEME
jgi:hypothetical protein